MFKQLTSSLAREIIIIIIIIIIINLVLLDHQIRYC
jgi:hypothetical protein